MINQKGEIVRSIPASCKDYNPDKKYPLKVRCSVLGELYRCKECGDKKCKNL